MAPESAFISRSRNREDEESSKYTNFIVFGSIGAFFLIMLGYYFYRKAKDDRCFREFSERINARTPIYRMCDPKMARGMSRFLYEANGGCDVWDDRSCQPEIERYIQLLSQALDPEELIDMYTQISNQIRQRSFEEKKKRLELSNLEADKELKSAKASKMTSQAIGAVSDIFTKTARTSVAREAVRRGAKTTISL